LLQVVTGTFPCGQQLVKYGYKEKAECTLCKKAHEESGSSWKGELPKETIGHIQSAGCLGQKEVVTAAHTACIRELLQAVDVHGKTDRHMKLLTIEKESRLGTLWDQEQCTQFCSKDELWKAAKEEEMRIPWKEGSEELSKAPRARGFLLERRMLVIFYFFLNFVTTESRFARSQSFRIRSGPIHNSPLLLALHMTFSQYPHTPGGIPQMQHAPSLVPPSAIATQPPPHKKR